MSAAVLAMALNQSGWRHRALVWGLIAVAAALFGAGLGWRYLKALAPVASVVGQLAANPMAWLVVVMAALVVLSVKRPKQLAAPGRIAAAATTNPPEADNRFGKPAVTLDTITPALNVGRIAVETGRLEDDLVIVIAIFAFNGNSHALDFVAARGAVRWAPWLPGGEGELEWLPPPLVTDGNETLRLPPYRDHVIRVEQHLTKADAARMIDALAGEGLSIDLREFSLAFRTDALPGLSLQLPLWNALTVRVMEKWVHTTRHTFAAAQLNVGSSATTG